MRIFKEQHGLGKTFRSRPNVSKYSSSFEEKKKTRVHKKHVDRFRPYTGKQLNGGISIAFLTEHA